MENSILSVYDKKPLPMDMDLSFEESNIKLQSSLEPMSQKSEDLDEDGFCVI